MSNHFERIYNEQLLENMIQNQIMRRGVKDKKVLDALMKYPREFFVRDSDKENAYDDNPLYIGENQTISQPYIVALMTELLELMGKEKILEIGTGSGYQTALLAELGREVYTLEIHKTLLEFAKKNLDRFGFKNIFFFHQNANQGLKEYAPFDRIISAAAPKEIPEEWKKQLQVKGIMVLPVGDFHQDLVVVKKIKENQFDIKKIIPVRFVPLL